VLRVLLAVTLRAQAQTVMQTRQQQQQCRSSMTWTEAGWLAGTQDAARCSLQLS
jgi:hypothetical protein